MRRKIQNITCRKYYESITGKLTGLKKEILWDKNGMLTGLLDA